MEQLKTSAAQRKAVREYEKKNDRINVIFPAGTRDRMKAVGVKTPSAFIKEVVAILGGVTALHISIESLEQSENAKSLILVMSGCKFMLVRL